ncbi:ATP-dependent RNA helicase DEAH12-like protein [Lachnellula subtilissima]|uniref:RBR-type E3 ubiquitin transferase n=1 Tax=Lachnellula subtilissima TaxID=602034 RepID=A0A8H8RNX4_9HELO|nr:ATP-dependent RNA helicase DEAH12-like protein [Lachnellula subtilissima]
MACADPFLQFDDQSFALQLQLQEIESQRELQSGKWKEDSPPDFALAFDDFEAELKKAIVLVEDLKFAHSIASAVDSDAVAIEESRVEEIQSVQDRDFALSLNEDDNLPSQDIANFPGKSRLGEESIEWDYVLRATEASTFSIESSSTVAGPSTRYTQLQRNVLEHLPQLIVECSVCGESVHPRLTVRLVCGDVYCKPCLKSFLLRVVKDESLFPPKCHRQPIDTSIIEANLSVKELLAYRTAELEFTTTDRVYCANPECAEFIPMPQRTLDYASCEACGAKTCMHCKALAHDGGCPADPARQSLIDFADDQGWKSCFGCGEMVFRYEGCDHMTCRCSAQFCYRCGVKWKECSCSDWVPELRNQRARLVVDREAPTPLAPAIHQRRVVAMEQELEANHECNHSGKFTKLEGSYRGMVCEMCGTRHRKYILSCKRCHMLACEDCRRHRL